ncbi:hypothetical protein FACS1894103_0270 [Campylobacterota bacterium]|nr:hypothetical protein FACS1894103_0270 [Campylobacterota bacterium]
MSDTAVLWEEIQSLSPELAAEVLDFVGYLKQKNQRGETTAYTAEKIEPFASEREALNFANDCALRLLNEAR